MNVPAPAIHHLTTLAWQNQETAAGATEAAAVCPGWLAAAVAEALLPPAKVLVVAEAAASARPAFGPQSSRHGWHSQHCLAR